MLTPRNMYIYLVSAISLQAFTWAIISLLRNMLIPNVFSDTTATAFQTAIILISLPVYLVHWLWAQRLANRDIEERNAVLRVLYLFGMQAGFLAPFIASAFGLINSLLFKITGHTPKGYYFELNSSDAIIFYLIPTLILILMWYYHLRILEQDAKVEPVQGTSSTIRRLYVYGFCSIGLAMTTMAVINLLRWFMAQIGGDNLVGVISSTGITSEIARLIVGLPLWVVFWQWAQRLFIEGNEEERESSLRKFYLYAIVFIAALTAVTSATFILEGIFRRVLDIPALGVSEGDIRIPISIIFTMALVWAYHFQVIKSDIKLAGEAQIQAGLRRLYIYLIAAIGLSAFLVGISGILSVLIRSIDQTTFGTGLQQQLAWFAAVTIAGLPVWYLPWRQAQKTAANTGSEGTSERRSVIRKIYLYFFLFVATMTVLSSVVYITFRLINMLLGEDPPTLSDLGQPIAYSMIAAGVWYYHWSVLRTDRQRMVLEQVKKLEDSSIVLVDVGDKYFSQKVMEGLKRENLGVSLISIDFGIEGEKTRISEEQKEIIDQLNQADLIISPWEIVKAGGASSEISNEITRAVVNSSAIKLLLPTRSERWEWVGVEKWDSEYFVRHTINAVKQFLKGEDVKLIKPLGAGAILGIIIGIIFLLILLSIPVTYLFGF